MPGLTTSRPRRGYIALLLGAFALMVSFMVPATAASAAPVAPSAAVVAQAAPAATATATTPLAMHCAKKARWKLDLKTQDSRLKFRVWHYTTSDKTRNFCVKIYKVKPKNNKTTIGLYVQNYKGDIWHATTKSSSLWAKVKVPKGKVASFVAHYGSIVYRQLDLNGYGT